MLLGLIVLAAVPAAVHVLLRWGLSWPIATPYTAEPRLHRTIVVGAVVLGLGVVVSDPDLRANLAPGRLADTEGLWAIGWQQFLAERANPLRHLQGLFGREEPASGFAAAAIAVAVAVLAAAAVLAATHSPGNQIKTILIVSFIVAIIMFAQTIYLSMLAAYLVHILNFWTIILWILIVQYFRKEKRAHGGQSH